MGPFNKRFKKSFKIRYEPVVEYTEDEFDKNNNGIILIDLCSKDSSNDKSISGGLLEPKNNDRIKLQNYFSEEFLDDNLTFTRLLDKIMLSNHYEFLDDKSIPCGLLTVSCEIEFLLNISSSTNISTLTELCEFKNEIHIDSMIELKDVVKE